ncbi:MAG: hypothetical protein ACE5EQ_06390 [Phycisphaerae bacterium]
MPYTFCLLAFIGGSTFSTLTADSLLQEKKLDQPDRAEASYEPRPAESQPAKDRVDRIKRIPSTQAAPPASRSVGSRPRIAREDLVLLVKNARRAFRATVKGLPERSSGYHPPELAGMKGIIHLTLRSHGIALAEAESAEMDVVDASVAAGTLLGRAALERKAEHGFGARLDDGGDALGIEFEWLGDRETLTMAYYGEGGVWTDALLHAFEPAVEGIGVEFRGKRGWTRPAEIISLNYSPDLALAAAERKVGLRHVSKVRVPKDIRYFRFWTVHLWQRAARASPVELIRGSTRVSPLRSEDAALVRDRIDAAIDRMGRYLHYRQNSGGGFSHEFAPGADRYNSGNSARVQLRALDGLAAYAAWCGRPEVVVDARRGIDVFRPYLEAMSVRSVDEAGETTQKPAGQVLVLPGHGGQLEITARLLSAMLTLDPVPSRSLDAKQDDSKKDDTQSGDELIAALLAAQTDEGRFAMVFDEDKAGGKASDSPAPRDLESSLALMTLARVFARRLAPSSASIDDGSKPSGIDSARVDRSILRCLSYYRRGKHPELAPASASFLARGFAHHYARTNDARLSDFVFDVADRLTLLQLHEDNCRYPELFGAINVREPGLVGVDTAIYLAVLADALVLAERVGDAQRVKRYRAATLSAVRFVLQLEVREIGCYFIRSPRDALGGVRTALWNSRIRVDHCANAVVALIDARRALYGDRD